MYIIYIYRVLDHEDLAQSSLYELAPVSDHVWESLRLGYPLYFLHYGTI